MLDQLEHLSISSLLYCYPFSHFLPSTPYAILSICLCRDTHTSFSHSSILCAMWSYKFATRVTGSAIVLTFLTFVRLSISIHRDDDISIKVDREKEMVCMSVMVSERETDFLSFFQLFSNCVTLIVRKFVKRIQRYHNKGLVYFSLFANDFAQ